MHIFPQTMHLWLHLVECTFTYDTLGAVCPAPEGEEDLIVVAKKTRDMTCRKHVLWGGALFTSLLYSTTRRATPRHAAPRRGPRLAKRPLRAGGLRLRAAGSEALRPITSLSARTRERGNETTLKEGRRIVASGRCTTLQYTLGGKMISV